MKPGQQQGCSCGGDLLLKGVCEFGATRQAQAQCDSGGGTRVLGPGPLHPVLMPMPGQRSAVFVLNLQVAVPEVALVQRTGLTVLRVQAFEQIGDFAEQGRVVRRCRAGQGVPAECAVRVVALVEIKKLECHDRKSCKARLSQGDQQDPDRCRWHRMRVLDTEKPLIA